VALAEEAAQALTGPEPGIWLARLEREHDNLRAALGWACERCSGDEGLRLAGALLRFWYMRGHVGEGRGWLAAALASDQRPHAARARALSGAGMLAEMQADYAQAVTLHEESLALMRELRDRRGIAQVLNNLGNVAHIQGEYGRAATLHEEALSLFRELGDKEGIAISLHNLGLVAQRQGDYGRAAALHEESLLLSHELGARNLVADCLEGLAWVTVVNGQAGRAARLGGAAEALREVLGALLPPDERAGHDLAVQAMRAALGEEDLASAWAKGRALPLEESIALALEGAPTP
jgi:tetratricopeptide (TPR) repeat protein